jgi:hypothetical protein
MGRRERRDADSGVQEARSRAIVRIRQVSRMNCDHGSGRQVLSQDSNDPAEEGRTKVRQSGCQLTFSHRSVSSRTNTGLRSLAAMMPRSCRACSRRSLLEVGWSSVACLSSYPSWPPRTASRRRVSQPRLPVSSSKGTCNSCIDERRGAASKACADWSCASSSRAHDAFPWPWVAAHS